MRRILFIDQERYLDRALRDAIRLFDVEGRYAGEDGASDLLAVVALPLAEVLCAFSETQTCDPFDSTHTQTVPHFSRESISVNGVWLLLTICQPDLLDPTPRHETLSQTLKTLKNRGCFQNPPVVFPVFLVGEQESSVAWQLAYLVDAHPELNTPVQVHYI